MSWVFVVAVVVTVVAAATLAASAWTGRVAERRDARQEDA